MEFTKVEIIENNCITTSFKDIIEIEDYEIINKLDIKNINIFFECNVKKIILINYICDYFVEDIVKEIYYFYYFEDIKEIIFQNIYYDCKNLKLNIDIANIKIKHIIDIIRVIDNDFCYRLSILSSIYLNAFCGDSERRCSLFYLDPNLRSDNIVYFNKDNINKYNEKELYNINLQENRKLINILFCENYYLIYSKLDCDKLNNMLDFR